MTSYKKLKEENEKLKEEIKNINRDRIMLTILLVIAIISIGYTIEFMKNNLTCIANKYIEGKFFLTHYNGKLYPL